MSQSGLDHSKLDIPIADQITMGPLQKYKKYGKLCDLMSDLDVFPWDFMIHLCIVVMTTL